jgi:hypothetical protein
MKVRTLDGPIREGAADYCNACRRGLGKRARRVEAAHLCLCLGCARRIGLAAMKGK